MLDHLKRGSAGIVPPGFELADRYYSHARLLRQVCLSHRIRPGGVRVTGLILRAEPDLITNSAHFGPWINHSCHEGPIADSIHGSAHARPIESLHYCEKFFLTEQVCIPLVA